MSACAAPQTATQQTRFQLLARTTISLGMVVLLHGVHVRWSIASIALMHCFVGCTLVVDVVRVSIVSLLRRHASMRDSTGGNGR